MPSAQTDCHHNALRRRLRLRILAATWIAYAGYYFCRKPFWIAKADLAESLSFTVGDLAALGTVYLAAYMAGQFSSALFGRWLGPKRLLLAGIGVSVISSVGFGLAESFAVAAVCIGFNGAAQGTGWPGCIGSLAPWFGRTERGTVLGVWATCYQVGSLAAAWYASFLLGRAGWRWSFLGGAAVLAAAWAAVIFLHPDSPEKWDVSPAEDSHAPEDAAPQLDDTGWGRNVVMAVIMMGCIYFCIKFLRYALWSWLPFFLKKNFGLSGEYAGYLSTVFDICGFAGVVVSGFVSDRLFGGKRALLSLVMLIMMTCSLAALSMLRPGQVTAFVACIGITGFMLFGPDALLSGVGAIDVGKRKGALAAAGIINGMGSIGPIFQEQLVGWIYTCAGERLLPILLMLAAVAVAATVMTGMLWFFCRRRNIDL